ncbi:MAG: DegT/DnrJ/EryC1/StrS family aminotransferase [Planctomycetes bacterium]|nr:DegT/DnrJ/EryC1/StrS family aminotransferase [Planctomycetota bacterium]
MKFINQIEPYLTEHEVAAVSEYLRSGSWLTEYKKTEEFEANIAEFMGTKYVVVLTSGTVALYLALLALDIGAGDSVVVPDYTMIATPNTVRWAGAEVILADVERETLCLDLDKIQLRENTKALMYVSINGRSGDMARVAEFCRANNLHLIEDACQAFGSKWDGRKLGTIGEMGIFSFTPHKIITTGQGGAVVTDNLELYEKIKKLKDFHRTQPGVDIHTGIGYNFKFTDLQSVVGIEQLKIIEHRIERKKAIYNMYQDGLSGLDFVEFLPANLDQTVPWCTDLILKDVTQDDFVTFLKDKNVGSRRFYPAVHTQEPYAQSQDPFEAAADLAPRGVWLPSSIGLVDEDIQYVIDTIQYFG